MSNTDSFIVQFDDFIPIGESLYELLPILLQPHIDPFRKIRTYADFIMLQVTSIGRIPNARSIEVSIHR